MSTTPTLRPAYELRPLGLSELIDYSFRLYQRIFPYLVIPTAILQAPFWIVIFYPILAYQKLMLIFASDPENLRDNPSLEDTILLAGEHLGIDLTFLYGWGMTEWITLAGGFMGLILLSAVALAVLQAGIVGLVGQRVLGFQPDWSHLFDIYRRFSLRAIGLSLVQALMMILLLVPGIGMITAGGIATSGGGGGMGLVLMIGGVVLLMLSYVGLAWLLIALYPATPALVVEDLGVLAAIRRSFALIRGHWWRVFGVFFVMSIIVQILSMFFTFISQAVLALIFPRAEVLIETVLQTLFSVFATPITLILLVLLYFDIRVRKEQFDLYYLLGQIRPDEPAVESGSAQ